jgi:hypothetical protein
VVNPDTLIHVTRDTESLGTFTPKFIEEALRQGALRYEDFAWHEGLEDWVPLSTLFRREIPDHVISPRTRVGSSESPARSGTDWQTRYGCLAFIGLIILLTVLDRCSPPRHYSTPMPESKGDRDGYPTDDFHAEQTRVYHESAKAAEEFNGRPLTDFEKEELWQFSRSDAQINLDEKRRNSYDPSEQPDH